MKYVHSQQKKLESFCKYYFFGIEKSFFLT